MCEEHSVPPRGRRVGCGVPGGGEQVGAGNRLGGSFLLHPAPTNSQIFIRPCPALFASQSSPERPAVRPSLPPLAAAAAGVLTPPLAGIGRSSAVALSVAGWAVVLSGRRKQELDETAALCGPGPALAVVGDITKEEDVVALIKAGEDKFGEPQLYSMYQCCAHCACWQGGSTCCSTYDPHLDVERSF